LNIRFTLDQLEVIETILRTGTFAAAARELHRATSAVSYAVRSLEEALGLPLFDRSKRKAQLTASGRLLVEASRDVLEQSRRLARLGQELREQWEPRLGIVVDGIFPLSPIMQALQKFSGAGVPTQVRLMVEYLSGVRERFEREGAELMLVLDHAGDPKLRARALPPIEMLLVAHRDHPLHARNRPHDRRTLSPFVELVVADSGRADDLAPHRLFIGSPQVFELSDFQSKREALLRGVGFGWIPRHLARDEIRRKELLPVGFEEGDRYVFVPHLCHRDEVPLGRGARLFLEHFDVALANDARRKRRRR
jgi:DNA-binding transcriptional LysR family regulator